MAEERALVERRRGVVVEKHEVGRAPLAQLAQAHREVPVGDPRVSDQERGERLGEPHRGVLLREVPHPERSAHLLEHVDGHRVGAQAHEDALAQHPRHVRHAHRVVHVGLRVVRDRGAGLGEQLHLAGAHVNAVSGDAPRAQDAELLEPLDHPEPELALAVFLVRGGLREVDVKPRARLAPGRGGALERRVGEREAGVQPEHPREAVVTAGLAASDERDVLLDPRLRDLGSVTVGELVAERGAHAGLLHGASEGVE